jgi:hypothetical protein
MIKATSVETQVLIQFSDKSLQYRLERRAGDSADWLALTDSGFIADDGTITPKAVADIFIDVYPMTGICQYRARDIARESAPWDYTVWFRRGTTNPIGYTYGNYKAPEGSWGEILTVDDVRGYLWGVDFRASNGESYTDEQIKFFIDAAMQGIERELNITIKQMRVKCEPERRGLKSGIDYDEEESYYTFKRERIQRNGMIPLRKRPAQSVSRLDLINRNERIHSLLDGCTLDKTKGLIKFFNRPPKMSESLRAVQTAIYPYGAETYDRNLSYAIDYVAGYPSSDAVPTDLREIVGKQAAVSLLNIIGRGLMSGFSSSSLSMDGASESFSSTQSATSAYYGADVKEYKDDIQNYISVNKFKFGHIVIGAL